MIKYFKEKKIFKLIKSDTKFVPFEQLSVKFLRMIREFLQESHEKINPQVFEKLNQLIGDESGQVQVQSEDKSFCIFNHVNNMKIDLNFKMEKRNLIKTSERFARIMIM